MPSQSTLDLIEFLRSIPPGRVISYGRAGELAGLPGGAASARQVVRILSSMSRSHDLPWWRILRKDGSIALSEGSGKELQAELLKAEGVEVDEAGRVDMGRYGLG
ncbi:MAG TPA: MGMT family protein [Rectinemataceae bacterium]